MHDTLFYVIENFWESHYFNVFCLMKFDLVVHLLPFACLRQHHKQTRQRYEMKNERNPSKTLKNLLKLHWNSLYTTQIIPFFRCFSCILCAFFTRVSINAFFVVAQDNLITYDCSFAQYENWIICSIINVTVVDAFLPCPVNHTHSCGAYFMQKFVLTSLHFEPGDGYQQKNNNKNLISTIVAAFFD